MWNTALKLITQLLIARFLRSRMQGFQDSINNQTQSHFSAVLKSVAALLSSHTTNFKAQINIETQRIFKSLLGLMMIFFAILISGFTGLVWLIALAWSSPDRNIILGATMILPILIAAGIFLAIRYNWKKQPFFAKSMVQIENDWQVFKNGLDGTADISDEANR